VLKVALHRSQSTCVVICSEESGQRADADTAEDRPSVETVESVQRQLEAQRRLLQEQLEREKEEQRRLLQEQLEREKEEQRKLLQEQLEKEKEEQRRKLQEQKEVTACSLCRCVCVRVCVRVCLARRHCNL